VVPRSQHVTHHDEPWHRPAHHTIFAVRGLRQDRCNALVTVITTTGARHHRDTTNGDGHDDIQAANRQYAAKARAVRLRTPVTTPTSDDIMGSTEISCDYANGDNTRRVTSELRLTGTSIVDAATEFAFRTAQNNPTVSSVSTIDGVGTKAACILADHHLVYGPKNELYVLLPGERIYEARDDAPKVGSESCDTLKQFAQAAIPRIGA
jgi:hypothetical protein